MSTEFRVYFEESDWLLRNAGFLRSIVTGLPSFVREPSTLEFWFKDSSSCHDWEYDLRLIAHGSDFMLVEVSVFGPAFFRDLKAMTEALSSKCPVYMTDDDGEPYHFPSGSD
jgi:hypothetical protein